MHVWPPNFNVTLSSRYSYAQSFSNRFLVVVMYLYVYGGSCFTGSGTVTGSGSGLGNSVVTLNAGWLYQDVVLSFVYV